MNVDEIKRIAVIGAGLMGHGIAQGFAHAGYEVRLNSRTEESLQRGIKNIQGNLQRLMDVGFVTSEQAESVLPKISTTTVLKEAVKEVDVVIEAVYEDLALKQQVFQELDKLCPERTILASTTSTLVPSKLASVTQRPDKVLVAHFTNLPYLMPLVEVVPSEKTSDEIVSIVYGLLTKMGKRHALIQKEEPGFILNRLQAAFAREPLSIVQKGIASPEDVDIVIKNSIGRRWSAAGFFELYDLIG